MTTSAIDSQKISNHQLRVIGDILEEFGVNRDDLRHLRADKGFAASVAELIKSRRNDGKPLVDTKSQAAARRIMGKNFLGLEEVRRHYDVLFSRDQRRRLSVIPFGAETLHECKDTHMLFPGFPYTVTEIAKGKGKKFLLMKDRKYEWMPFANEQRVELRWYLLRKGPVPESGNKKYEEQILLLTKDEQVPHACEISYGFTLYQLATNEILLQKKRDLVRTEKIVCADRSADSNSCYPHGRRIEICVYHDGEICFYECDNWRSSDIFLSSERIR